MQLPLLGQQPDAVTTGLLQYGGVGILALLCLAGMWVLWKRIDRIYDTEHQRADRLENELRDLNKLITGELSGHLVRATEAMREVTEMLRQRDRGDR